MRRQLSWLILSLLVASGLAISGCAGASNAAAGEDSPEKLAGSPPEDQEEFRVEHLPRGPEVLTDQPKDSSRPAPENASAEDEVAGQITRAELNAFIHKGPSFGLAMVQVEPARDAQEFSGFKVVEIHPTAAPLLGDKLILGDIITHLNGVEIKTPDDYMSAWRTLARRDEVSINLIRAASPRRAVWQIKDD